MAKTPAETITKMDAGRRQLRTAIRLFFANEDAISVHTLAAAAHGILRDLNQPFTIKTCEGVELAGTGSFIKDNPLIKPNKKQHVIRSINRAQNFFKHAADDPDAKLDFRPELSEFLLFDACLMYQNITGRHLREGSLFMMWYMVKYPEIFSDGASKMFIAVCQAIDFTSADKAVIHELIKSGAPIPGTD